MVADMNLTRTRGFQSATLHLQICNYNTIVKNIELLSVLKENQNHILNFESAETY